MAAPKSSCIAFPDGAVCCAESWYIQKLGRSQMRSGFPLTNVRCEPVVEYIYLLNFCATHLTDTVILGDLQCNEKY